MSDIDSMTEISFRKYIIYVLKKLGFQASIEVMKIGFRGDIVGIYENKSYVFELKLYRDKRISLSVIDQLERLSESSDDEMVLITNAILPEDLVMEERDVILIGRKELREIIWNPKRLIEKINRSK